MATCKLVYPTPEEVAAEGPGHVWSECEGCGGRNIVRTPCDLSVALDAMRVVIVAHEGCAALPLRPLALTEDRSSDQLAEDGDAGHG